MSDAVCLAAIAAVLAVHDRDELDAEESLQEVRHVMELRTAGRYAHAEAVAALKRAVA